jgi:hypothetical protein
MNKYIIALDFDLTISCDHSHGYPLENPPSNSVQIHDTIKRWQNAGHRVVLITRAVKYSIATYMERIGISIPIFAPDEGKFNKHSELDYWARYKYKCLMRIRTKTNMNIIFIDDTVQNIQYIKDYAPDIIALNATPGDVIKNIALVDQIVAL